MCDKIDFVITWVDGNDPAWQKERNHYAALEGKEIDNSSCRYRDWGTLRYWFRGVEKFAPWVNNIYFVTWGHLPEWLNVNHPKLKLIKHSDYIPSEYLPTFSSRTIDFFFHRIPGLSEHFVYFNDDMFLISKVGPGRFFRKGLPCDTGGFFIYNRNGMFGTSVYLSIQQINNHFDKLVTVSNSPSKWFNLKYPSYSFRNLLSFTSKIREFCGFFDHHLAQGYLKSIYEEVWGKCDKDLRRTSKNKFRHYGDLAPWLLRYWQLASNKFSPINVYKDGAYYNIQENNISEITECISQQHKKLICLNDTDLTNHFEDAQSRIINAFNIILPEKCSFEL